MSGNCARRGACLIHGGPEPPASSRLPTPEEHVRAVREADRATGSEIGLLTADHVRARDAAILARLDAIDRCNLGPPGSVARDMLDALRAELRGAS